MTMGAHGPIRNTRNRHIGVVLPSMRAVASVERGEEGGDRQGERRKGGGNANNKRGFYHTPPSIVCVDV